MEAPLSLVNKGGAMTVFNLQGKRQEPSLEVQQFEEVVRRADEAARPEIELFEQALAQTKALAHEIMIPPGR